MSLVNVTKDVCFVQTNFRGTTVAQVLTMKQNWTRWIANTSRISKSPSNSSLKDLCPIQKIAMLTSWFTEQK